MTTDSAGMTAETSSPASAPAAAAGGEYEFSDGHNVVFKELGGTMRFVGTALLVLGGIMALGGLAQLVTGHSQGAGSIIQALLFVVVGARSRTASAAVDRIATTKGNDIANLMTAMGELLGIYNLQRRLIIFAIVMFVVGLLLGILGTMK